MALTAGLRVVDVVRDACASIMSRPGRALLTLAGTTLGVASLVTTSGLAASANDNVRRTFDTFKATEVVLREDPSSATLPLRGVERTLASITGLRQAGVICDQSPREVRVQRAVASHEGTDTSIASVIAVSPGALTALRPTWRSGGPYNAQQEALALPVAVVGAGVARSLDLSHPRVSPHITVDGATFQVLGVIEDVKRRAVALNSVLIPTSAADELWGPTCVSPREVLIETEIGYADLIGTRAPLLLDALHPSRFSAQVPPDPRLLQRSVEGDLEGLFMALAVVALSIGALSIFTTFSVSVLERKAEIGLRRSLGFSRLAIAGLITSEAVLAGAVGGLLGAGSGVACVLVLAETRDWVATYQPTLVLLGPCLGAAAGLLGGAVPAARAARMNPAEAVRS